MKRIIALAIIFIFITGGMQVFGGNASKLTYNIAKDELLKNNTAIKINQNIERQAYFSYYDSTAQALLINPKGTDLRIKIQLTAAKELPPEQAKNAWEGSIENCRNRLKLNRLSLKTF